RRLFPRKDQDKSLRAFSCAVPTTPLIRPFNCPGPLTEHSSQINLKPSLAMSTNPCPLAVKGPNSAENFSIVARSRSDLTIAEKIKGLSNNFGKRSVLGQANAAHVLRIDGKVILKSPFNW